MREKKEPAAKQMDVADHYECFLSKVIVGIGEVSAITGVPVRKLRYWQEKGIIRPVDADATSRQFDLANVKKVILIQELLEDGYSLDGAAAKVAARTERMSSIFALLNLPEKQ